MLKIVPTSSDKIMLFLNANIEDAILDIENLFFPIFFLKKYY